MSAEKAEKTPPEKRDSEGVGTGKGEGKDADAPLSGRGITLTEKAAQEVQRIIQEQNYPPDTALRVGAKGGGCSGFSYVLDFDHNPKTEFDLEYQSHGVRVLIDKKSEFFMGGTVIDFDDSNLLNRGFVFKNPKAQGSCGCGVSFQV